MDKKIIFNQFFGIGDILFSEPIARHYFEQGYQVIWPVEDHYYWVKDYVRYVDFRKKSEFQMDYEQCRMDYEFEGIPVLPLRFSTPILRNTDPHDGSLKEHFMLDKYRLTELPLDLWKTMQFNRNTDKEDALFEMVVKEQPYTFVNKFYGGGFQSHEDWAGIEGVQLAKIPGFTLLDWCKVICEADIIHTVETAVFYLVETLPIEAREIHLHPRMPWEGGLPGVKNFMSKKWITHEIIEQ